MMITIKKASELTGLPYSYIRKLCLENKVKFINSGVKYYILKDSLIDYCNGGKIAC